MRTGSCSIPSASASSRAPPGARPGAAPGAAGPGQRQRGVALGELAQAAFVAALGGADLHLVPRRSPSASAITSVRRRARADNDGRGTEGAA